MWRITRRSSNARTKPAIRTISSRLPKTACRLGKQSSFDGLLINGDGKPAQSFVRNFWADLGGRRSANSRITAPGTALAKIDNGFISAGDCYARDIGVSGVPSAMSSAPSLFMLHTVSAIGGTLLDSICANCLSILCSSATCFRHNSMPPMAKRNQSSKRRGRQS